MNEKTKNVLEAVLWILGFIALGLLAYGFIRMLI